MTDTLIREDPNDTGEIPKVDPGTTTRNLAPYDVLPPAFRRPTAEVPHIVLGQCWAALDGDLMPPDPGQPRPQPGPMPTPGPTPPRVDDRPRAAGEEIAWRPDAWQLETPPRGWWARLRYQGAHRAAGR